MAEIDVNTIKGKTIKDLEYISKKIKKKITQLEKTPLYNSNNESTNFAHEMSMLASEYVNIKKSIIEIVRI